MEVVRCANERCDQENIIEQLKNGVNELRVPLYELNSNWAYMVDRRTGLEYQVVVIPDDAPKERPEASTSAGSSGASSTASS